ncbi:hypothetical protein BGZ60DRAFT_513670 [Tricladium varicosporioides]|nr:hypothetical protein BGZ60DRAFT_513670 [Hymenoscyphus varicosporioides]
MAIFKSLVASLALMAVAHTAAISAEVEIADVLPNLIVMTREFEGGEWSFAPQHHERIRREHAAVPIEKRSRAQLKLYKTNDCTGTYASSIEVVFSQNYCNAAVGINCIVVADLEDAHISYWNNVGCNGRISKHNGCGAFVLPTPGTNSIGIQTGCIAKREEARLAKIEEAPIKERATEISTANVLPNLGIMVKGPDGVFRQSKIREDEYRKSYIAGNIKARATSKISVCQSEFCTACTDINSVNYDKNFCVNTQGVDCIIVQELTNAHISYWNNQNCNGRITQYHNCGINKWVQLSAPGTNSVGIQTGC